MFYDLTGNELVIVTVIMIATGTVVAALIAQMKTKKRRAENEFNKALLLRRYGA